METIRLVTSTPPENAYAYALTDASIRTHQAVAAAWEARLPYIRRFKAKKILTGEDRIAERLVYSCCFDTIAADHGGNVVDGLLSALEEKRLEVNITTFAKSASCLAVHGRQASTRHTGQAHRQAGQEQGQA
jgi:hypothetical protein